MSGSERTAQWYRCEEGYEFAVIPGEGADPGAGRYCPYCGGPAEPIVNKARKETDRGENND